MLRRGRRRACDTAVVHVLDRGDAEPGRLTVVATKRVGNAVDRNRAKRLLREAARAIGVHDGCDVVLVARPATVHSTAPVVTRDIERLFDDRIGGSAAPRPSSVRTS